MTTVNPPPVLGECPPHEPVDGGLHCGKCGATLTQGFQSGTLLPGVDSPQVWQDELAVAPQPMVKAAGQRIGKHIEIHVIGGLTADGTLESLDEDDGTITVVDEQRRFVIALNAIAALAWRLKAPVA